MLESLLLLRVYKLESIKAVLKCLFPAVSLLSFPCRPNNNSFSKDVASKPGGFCNLFDCTFYFVLTAKTECGHGQKGYLQLDGRHLSARFIVLKFPSMLKMIRLESSLLPVLLTLTLQSLYSN